jgi:hypothetical protein
MGSFSLYRVPWERKPSCAKNYKRHVKRLRYQTFKDLDWVSIWEARGHESHQISGGAGWQHIDPDGSRDRAAAWP